MIPNNVPPVSGKELQYIAQVVNGGTLSDGGGHFSQLCQAWLEQRLGCPKVLLTPSGTAALELAALALEIEPGDEVIVPSYTYMSTANAFLLRGASLVYVDVEPETMNMDANKVREAISPKTRAVVPVHYAGVPCNMEAIRDAIGNRKDIYVIEDAAQGLFSSYKDGRALGSIGHIGCISFHATKNVTAGGAGGAIIINDPALIERTETIRDKGTNRPQFLRGETDHYVWQRVGVSHLLSEMQAAYLWAQLEVADQIQAHRLKLWEFYRQNLAGLQDKGIGIPSECSEGQHNAHIFFIKVRDAKERREFTLAMKEQGIAVLAHYGPLHRTPPGLQGRHVLHPEDFASRESERLVRLPLYYAMTLDMAKYVVDQVQQFFV
ncbi:pyridoxal phosphate-dependent transferase [Aspergillus bertholletiae]|uniref:Pyridoxal phosphate-dependent transferase n=1 Tax=Aspergillus bertholletiae TaxID=1226010 RepID=A0A5N7AT16_9EURO|nr:pyridoxal phosphate-dependent transferase [Aspergillus bertholletiae]